MEFHLAVIFLVMPIMACSAQYGWLRERQFHQPFNNNPLAPQKQSTFKFLYPSTTPSPFNKNPAPKARHDFNDGVNAGFMGGGSWYDVPSDGANGGSDTGNGVAVNNGDTSTNVETWSFWDFDMGGGNDFAGGQSTNGGYGGAGAGVGGRGGTAMGGRGGMSGAGGGFVGSEDGMQRLKGASAGSIAGIVVGVIILICVVGGGLFVLMRGIHKNALYGTEALTP